LQELFFKGEKIYVAAPNILNGNRISWERIVHPSA